MELTINTTEKLKSRPDDDKLGFGSIFSDYMFNMDYNPEKGWFNPRIEPYQDFQMDPATMVLHYGQAVFEGLKAFRNEAGAILPSGVYFARLDVNAGSYSRKLVLLK